MTKIPYSIRIESKLLKELKEKGTKWAYEQLKNMK